MKDDNLAGLPMADKSMEEVIRLLTPHLVHRTWPKDHVLWSEGDQDGRLVAIKKGRVKIVKMGPGGMGVLVFVFGPGDVFGFLPFVDGGPYPATAITIDEVEALVMSRSKLRQVLREDPGLAFNLMAVLGKRLREAMARLQEVLGGASLTRVAAALVALLPPEPKGLGLDIVHLPRPAYVFANQMGITPETLSRTLTRLEGAKVIHRLGRGRIQVLDLEALRNLAAGYQGPFTRSRANARHLEKGVS